MYSILLKSYLFVFVKINFPGCSFSINMYSPFISSFLPSIQGFQHISPYFRLDKVGRSDPSVAETFPQSPYITINLKITLESDHPKP